MRAGSFSQTELLEAAGFARIEARDVTPEFVVTNRRWYELREANAAELSAIEGEEDFHERQADLRTQRKATEEGLLVRYMLVAQRP